MFLASMAIFALVISVAALGVAWLTMSASAAGVTKLDSRIDLLQAATRALEQRAMKSAPETLRAELDDLRGALGVLSASNRREFGSLWGRLGGRGSNHGKIIDGDSGLPLEGDDEIEAVLALQRAQPVKPS